MFRNIGPKKIGHTNFGSKIILGQSLVKISVVLAEIFHHAQTRTNLAGTNLAWSNVPKTHKKLFLSRNLDLDSEMSGQYIWTQRAVRFCRLRGNRLLSELRTWTFVLGMSLNFWLLKMSRFYQKKILELGSQLPDFLHVWRS